MSTTKPDSETAGLRHAINEMNEQPDISANDSPRLREFCRVTAMEVKAVGGASASTTLEMIGYIRELERSQVGENDYVAWCRYTYNSEGGIQSIVTCDSHAKGAFKVYRASPPDFEQLQRLRDWKESAMTLLSRYDSIAEMFGGKLGSSKIDNLERAVERLRSAARNAMEWMSWWVESEGADIPDGVPSTPEILAALREALTHTGEQS